MAITIASLISSSAIDKSILGISIAGKPAGTLPTTFPPNDSYPIK